MDIIELSQRLGIEKVPGTWIECWPGFEEWRAAGGCGDLSWELPAEACRVFDLQDGAASDLECIYRIIGKDSDLSSLMEFWHYMIYHLPGGMERNSNVWNLPDSLKGFSTSLLSLAAMVSGCGHAVRNFEKTGLSDEIALASLGYIGRYAMDIKEKRGVWGLESIGWLSNYVRAKVFRLGRLSFKSGESPLPFRVMRNIETGDIIALCEPTFRYRSDGFTDGTEGEFDQEAWTPVLKLESGVITGHPVLEGCVAGREAVDITADDWMQVLSPGEPIVEVHVAAGSRMLPEACIDSFRRAVEFFPSYYSGTKFRGFTCSSWLLDPAFPTILPSESNILQFQNFFHTVPVLTSGAQAYDLIFGNPDFDIKNAVPKTSLQKAIVDFVHGGGVLRPASGYILWDEAARF